MGNTMDVEEAEACRESIRQQKANAIRQALEARPRRSSRYLVKKEPTPPEPEVTDYDVYVRQSEQVFSLQNWKNPSNKKHPPSMTLPEPSLHLTETEKGMLRESWMDFIPDLAGTGARVFHKIHQLYPKIAPLFRYNKDADAMLDDPLVRSHGRKFMHAIGAAIRHLDTMDKDVAPAFVNLGKQHVRFKGLDLEYFSIFTGAMMLIWKEELGDKFSGDLRQAWRHLFNYLMDHMRFGFNFARDQMRKSEELGEESKENGYEH